MWHVWPSFLEWPDLRFLASGLSCELSHDRHVCSSDTVIWLGLTVGLRQFGSLFVTSFLSYCWLLMDKILQHSLKNLVIHVTSCDIYPYAWMIQAIRAKSEYISHIFVCFWNNPSFIHTIQQSLGTHPTESWSFWCTEVDEIFQIDQTIASTNGKCRQENGNRLGVAPSQ